MRSQFAWLSLVASLLANATAEAGHGSYGGMSNQPVPRLYDRIVRNTSG